MKRASPSSSDSSPLVIWSISDGRPGHTSQALGLIRAMEVQATVESHVLPVPSPLRAWSDCLLRRTALGSDLQDPHLILGAGHRTHPAMLAVRAARGGRTIVLMQPSLPLTMFDLAIIPEHDSPKRRDNVIVTRGAINPIRPAANPNPKVGLFMLGGPSRHAEWSDEHVAQQISEIVRASDEVQWQLTTSRRTPETTVDALRSLDTPNLTITLFSDTSPGWVAEQLQRCARVWVSADSVSMMYEALTAGAAVGVLHVGVRGASRVSAGLERLIEQGFVTPFERWRESKLLVTAPQRFCEADRCAAIILKRWFAGRMSGTEQGVCSREGAME